MQIFYFVIYLTETLSNVFKKPQITANFFKCL